MHRRLALLVAVLALATSMSQAAEQPEPPAEMTLTLDEALDLARAQNLTVLAALEDIKRTRGVLREGYATAYPSLTATGSVTRLDESAISTLESAEGSITFGTDKTYAYNLGLEQRLYAGGLVAGGIRAARSNKLRTLELVAATVQDVELQTRRDFYELLLAQELVAVREEAVTLFEENLSNVQLKFDAGQVNKFEVTRARVALTNLRTPLIASKNRVRLAKEGLKKTLNVPFDTEIEISGTLDYAPARFELDELVQTALQFRHEINAAKLETTLRKINITVEASDGRPDVRAFANYEGRTDIFGTSASDLTQGWNAGITASIPLFKGWSVAGRIEQARADYAKSLIALADQRKSIELEVRRAWFMVQDAAARVMSQQGNVGLAKQALANVIELGRVGLSTQWEVRETQLSLTEARTNLKQAQHDYNVALFALERAVGVPLEPLNTRE